MDWRRWVAVIGLVLAGFVAYQVILGFNSPAAESPADEPPVAGFEEDDPVPEEPMAAIVPAVLARRLHAAMTEEHSLPELPEEAALLAVAGNDGEFFYATNRDGIAEVRVMRSGGSELVWSTRSEKALEIVGAHGSELLLKFIDEPFDGPAAAWQPGGFYGLDIFAAGVGVYPANFEAETIEVVRGTIARN